ncbi:uncharacterized protein LOC132554041 [Ylistrum balloti]|uniref:uncharacterized protein LOC132554041 n=1 Tax=Ylistrum balloti TaxID=509963 RepID=UPI00290582A3|nr:uncharacterized protein LOC132554041 [Ylistrum balloti]
MGPMYYMAVIAVVTSLVFKLIAILAWIPLRVAFDRDLRGEMYRALQDYYVTDNPASGIALYIEDKNLGFNTLFHQGKCCLRQSSVFSNLQLNGRLTGSWPWTCNHCDNDYGIRWPYLNSYVRNLCPINSAYSEDCTTTILDSTLHHYDTTAVVFAALMILLDILLLVILDRAYKGRVARGDRGIFSNIFLNNRSAKIMRFEELLSFIEMIN